MHQSLLRYSDKDVRHRGKYKVLSNKVVANYPDGMQKVIFNTTDAHLVASEMEGLIHWTNEQFAKQDIHSLIIIAHFIYEFLSIHPFQDGNGRLARLLTTLLLLQNNYFFIQYVSFENLIEATKKAYYQALISGQQHRNTSKENIAGWLVYFLDKIHVLTQKLDAKYDVFKSRGGYLNERQKEIKKYLQQHQPLKISDIAKEFNCMSRNTIKKDLQYLKQEQVIRSVGQGRGTVYLIVKQE